MPNIHGTMDYTALRRSRLTQAEMADVLGTSRMTVWRFEQGLHGDFSANMLARFAAAYQALEFVPPRRVPRERPDFFAVCLEPGGVCVSWRSRHEFVPFAEPQTLADLRARSGTRAEVARRLGVCTATLGVFERHGSTLSLDLAAKLATAYAEFADLPPRHVRRPVTVTFEWRRSTIVLHVRRGVKAEQHELAYVRGL